MTKVNSGKKVINTHISDEEHKFLKEMAKKNSMTLTMYLRLLIRNDMRSVGQLNNYLKHDK
ncbi:MAG: hypothetical protein AB1756_08535 [Acidobacteriota bacterium]